MLKKIQLFVGMVTLAFMGSVTMPTPAYACSDSLMGIPAWYRNLQDSSCNVKIPKDSKGDANVTKFILNIAMNVIQAGLVLAAYVAVFFIIKGGFGYITSAGSPDGMQSAKKTITNAVIGLVIAVLSASIVNAIAGIL